MATATRKARSTSAAQSPRRGGSATKRSPAKTPPKAKLRGGAPTPSPKRKLGFDDGPARDDDEDEAARFSLTLPDGSAWSSDSWLAAVDQMKLLQQSAEGLASTAAARGAAAALARIVRESEVGSGPGAGRRHAGARGVAVGKSESMRLARSELCERFNHNSAAAAAKRADVSVAPCPTALVKQALDAAYDVAVTNPRQLNKYKPFSREVYGETNASLVQHIIETQQITSADTFFDLGSGIGQVVLQAAATTGCRAVGVELMDIPAQYATALQAAFDIEYALQSPHPSCSVCPCARSTQQSLTGWTRADDRLRRWGRALAHAPALVHGDMFTCTDLTDATAIFVNNFAFPVELSQALGAHIEANCAPGTKVLTYKPIIAMGRRRRTTAANTRTASQPQPAATGLREVGRGVFEHDGVSWTSGPIEYISYLLG